MLGKKVISALGKKEQSNIGLVNPGSEAEDVKYKPRWSQLFHPHSWSIFYNTKHQVNCAIYLEHQQFCLVRIANGPLVFSSVDQSKSLQSSVKGECYDLVNIL